MTGKESAQSISELLGLAFSDEQMRAITARPEPGVIIAGAGTGKTTVMAARVVHLVSSGKVLPDQVLGLTFTRKAAGELASRITGALEQAGFATDLDDHPGPSIMTYDAFAGALTRDYGLRLGIDLGQNLLDDAARFILADRAVAEAQGPFAELSAYQPSSIVTMVLGLDQAMAAHLVSSDQVRAFDRDFASALRQVRLYRGQQTAAVRDGLQTVAKREELLELVEAYRRLKAEYSAVEFADQMANATLLAADAEISRQMRERFRVVLLDEYQDTSAANARLLRGLFSGPDASRGRGHPVTAVGDPFQAIYAWRGAAPANISRFSRDFLLSDDSPAPTFNLTINRRSRSAILEAANRVSADLLSEPVSGGTNRGALVWPEDAVGGLVDFQLFATLTEELDWLATTVAGEYSPDTRWNDMAILVRRNRDIAAIYTRLVEAGIPVEIVGLGGLLEVREIADIVAAMTLIADVQANPAVVHLLTGHRWRIGPRDLALLGRRVGQITAERRDEYPQQDDFGSDPVDLACLMDAVADPGPLPYSPEARQRLGRFSEEMTRLRRYRDRPPAEIITRIIDSSGLMSELLADLRCPVGGRSAQVEHFIDIAVEFVDLDGRSSLEAFLAYLEVQRDEIDGIDQATPSAGDSVKLMTMHRAKGLEWQVVFLPAMVEQVFPSLRGRDNWTTNAQVLPAPLRGDAEWVCQLDEVTSKELKSGYPERLKVEQLIAETRLAYVAVTRAKRVLHASGHFWASGLKKPRVLSRYVPDLDPGVAARQATVVDEGCGPGTAPRVVCATNPLDEGGDFVTWPTPVDPETLVRNRELAESIRRAGQGDLHVDPADLDEAQVIAWWHRNATEVVAGLRERAGQTDRVGLPRGLTVSGVMAASHDLTAFLDSVRRPMPRPFVKEASVGTRFHEWVETYYGRSITPLVEIDEIEDYPPSEIGWADRRLARLIEAFRSGQFAQRTPIAMEESFVLVVGSHQVRGRIDAVFTSTHPDYDVDIVDWKTSTTPPDPLQLSFYRLAWSQTHDIPIGRVRAGFFQVSDDHLVFPELQDEQELREMINNFTRRADTAG